MEMTRAKSETALAWLTLASAVVHFSGETYYTVKFGQPVLSLLPDYFSNTLMLLGSWRSLNARPGTGAGALAAAWGFAFCLAYVATFGRVQRMLDGAAPWRGEPTIVLTVLLVAFAVAAAIFAWSLWLAYRTK